MSVGFQGIRTWINRHGAVVAASLIVIATVAVLSTRSCKSTVPTVVPTRAFFVDEVTREIEIQPIDAISPLPGKTGQPTLVQGFYYTLGTDAEKQLGYMQKYTPTGRAALEKFRQAPPNAMSPEQASLISSINAEVLVRGPEEGSNWVPVESPAGLEITGRLNQLSQQKGFRIVLPSNK